MVALHESPDSTWRDNVRVSRPETSANSSFLESPPKPVSKNLLKGKDETGVQVANEVLGDDKEHNKNMIHLRSGSSDILEDQAILPGLSVRQAITKDLSDCLASMKESLGEPSLAVQVRILKEKLSEAHDKIAYFPDEENDFRSLITLVESYLSQWKWKQYTASHLQVVESAFKRAASLDTFGYNDLVQIRRDFRSNKIRTLPIIPIEVHEADQDDEV
jgi:hypothetical protein